MKITDPDDIRSVKGIGEQKARSFSRMGILSCTDLLSFYPRRYEDRSTVQTIASVPDGGTALIHAVIAEDPKLSRIRQGCTLLKFRVFDDSGSCQVVFFNQNYLKSQFRKGEEIALYGKITLYGTGRSMTNPVWEPVNARKVTGTIVPVYHLSEGLTQNDLKNAVRASLNQHLSDVKELLPEIILKEEHLPSVKEALSNIHFPSSCADLENARKYFVFQELFLLTLALSRNRHSRSENPGIVMEKTDLTPFTAALPFSLTNAQKNAIARCLEDLKSGKSMSRLVQGDVGSGKTMVAAVLIYVTAKNGYLSALMAPTEILAKQHYNTLQPLLSSLGLRVGLLTGSLQGKPEIKKMLKEGQFDLIIGTHALISPDVEMKNLGLIITDEQHRFGVAQRSALISKSTCPHVLVMSATPIPRTLALSIYGDLDLTIMDELPPGRQKVQTFAVDESYRERLNGFIRKTVKEGRQVYVICPKIEEEEEGSDPALKSAVQHCQELSAALPDLKFGCVHGKMNPGEKEDIMNRFHKGELDVLVSTTVVEVGVDVPNAALIVIENAERFGLSQLHQLRGRVGRGTTASYCILMCTSRSKEALERLSILCKTHDGYRLAEEDLRLRGPGDFFSNRQHGLPELHLADLGADSSVIPIAQSWAERILSSDPSLTAYPELKDTVDRLFVSSRERLN